MELPVRFEFPLHHQIPFGTELEVAGFDILKQYQKNSFRELDVNYQINTRYEENKISDYHKWLFTHDSSIMQNTRGVEVISPISLLNQKFILELMKLCNFLTKYDGFITEECSQHIHVGFHIFPNLDSVKTFFLLYSLTEPELNRFFAGEQETLRAPAEFCFAQNITKLLHKIDKVTKLFQENDPAMFIQRLHIMEKRYALNGRNIKSFSRENRNTIELRSPNGSLNPIILENNVYFLLKMIEYCIENPKWQNLYEVWKLQDEEKNRLPDQNTALKLSRMILKDRTDLKYFDWQYEKHFK